MNLANQNLIYSTLRPADEPLPPELIAEDSSEKAWRELLKNYFFKVADSFAFSGVLERADFYPSHFFEDWDLVLAHELLETSNEDIVATFYLNDSCKSKLLCKIDYVYQPIEFFDGRTGKSFEPPDFFPSVYYEYTYFFKEKTCLAYYNHYDDWCVFTHVNDYIEQLNQLAPFVKKFIEPVP